MNIAVTAFDYLGLVSGTCFTEMHNSAICIDIDQDKF